MEDFVLCQSENPEVKIFNTLHVMDSYISDHNKNTTENIQINKPTPIKYVKRWLDKEYITQSMGTDYYQSSSVDESYASGALGNPYGISFIGDDYIQI
ncbi:Hypothetical protein ORPV_594 [Orpheovirus IHUMI-LCC2]|uniref:Uncharacterized protein n=1 Tax=Orpheovirus IHUMI-LCC2 TaxID=2023057 RepID=A0A2I2L4N0_9VIRU|nr:Hypothetical protein ORPV_594 [Orpheovirus IHUMI-LCC2]SNW62498.1 Hypothetical protein ORPV_594 [Orpheovirus IHUMI-LCC2]